MYNVNKMWSFIFFFFFQIVIAIFSFVYGNPLRVINGYDSFGNTCGVKKNEHYPNYPLSGLNTIDKPHLLYFDVRKLKDSIKVCVKECPKKTVTNRNEVYNYYLETQNNLCRYDFNISDIANDKQGDLSKLFNYLGPCPELPIYERY